MITVYHKTALEDLPKACMSGVPERCKYYVSKIYKITSISHTIAPLAK